MRLSSNPDQAAMWKYYSAGAAKPNSLNGLHTWRDFLTVLVAGHSRSGCHTVSFWWDLSLWLVDGYLLALWPHAVFFVRVPGEKKASSLLSLPARAPVSSEQGSIPMTSSRHNFSQRLHIPTLSTEGQLLNTSFMGDTIQSTSLNLGNMYSIWADFLTL